MIHRYEWIPGGHQIALNTNTVEYGLFINDDLHVVDADSSTVRTLLPPGRGGEFHVSPDGQLVAIVTSGDYDQRPGGISLVSLNGDARLSDLVSYPSILTYSEYAYYPEPRWSPDSSFLRVAIPSPETLAPDARSTLWEIQADGSSVRELVTVENEPLFGGVSFSPDLQRIAYLRGERENNRFELHIARADGSADILYQVGNVAFISWAPDAQQFVFNSAGLMLGHINREPVEVAEAANPGEVRWIDSARYLFVNFVPDEGVELRLGPTGGESQRLFVFGEGFPVYDFYK